MIEEDCVVKEVEKVSEVSDDNEVEGQECPSVSFSANFDKTLIEALDTEPLQRILIFTTIKLLGKLTMAMGAWTA